MRHDSKVKLVALLCLVLSLVGSGVLSPKLAASSGRHNLSYTELAEQGDPPQVALGIAMGAFRGVFVNFLWIRANRLKQEGQFFEANELSRAITKLQPRFPRVWVFHAWNMSYNISVSTQTPEERWQWVQAGIRLLREEGIPANPKNMLLHKELAWVYLHKIGGYTDDSNQFYKRQVAQQWQVILGAPPERDYENRSRERRIQQFSQWLRPLVDAPGSYTALRERNPLAAELGDAFEAAMHEPIAQSLLRRYAFFEALEKAGRIESTLPRLGPNGQAFYELWSNEIYAANAWDDLIAYERKRTLEDDYHMEPLRMLRMTERFGPIDWRLPAAHALFWSYRGVDVGHLKVDEHNTDSLDFVNTYRIVAQSIQDLWRYGDLYFNFLDVTEGRRGYYQVAPNPYFVQSYGEVFEETARYSGIFESDRRADRVYAAGYENFLTDAVAFFYRRGDITQAERWYTRLRTWEGQNLSQRQFKLHELSVPLEEFVRKNLIDRMDSPSIAVQEMAGAIQGAFMSGLLKNDDDAFWGMWNYAQTVHKHYNKMQHREIVAGGKTARTEFLDRDFRLVAGSLFAEIIVSMPPSEAELLYYNAGKVGGDLLQKYAYDTLKERYEPILEQVESERSFEEIFTEPLGMDEFRVWYAAQKAARDDRGVEGIREK